MLVTRAMKLIMPVGSPVGDGPSAPSADPDGVVIAQSDLPADADALVSLLDSTWDATAGKRVVPVARVSQQQVRALRIMMQTQLAMAQENAPQLQRAVHGTDRQGVRQLAELLARSSESLDVGEVEEAQEHELQLVG